MSYIPPENKRLKFDLRILTTAEPTFPSSFNASAEPSSLTPLSPIFSDKTLSVPPISNENKQYLDINNSSRTPRIPTELIQHNRTSNTFNPSKNNRKLSVHLKEVGQIVFERIKKLNSIYETSAQSAEIQETPEYLVENLTGSSARTSIMSNSEQIAVDFSENDSDHSETVESTAVGENKSIPPSRYTAHKRGINKRKLCCCIACPLCCWTNPWNLITKKKRSFNSNAALQGNSKGISMTPEKRKKVIKKRRDCCCIILLIMIIIILLSNIIALDVNHFRSPALTDRWEDTISSNTTKNPSSPINIAIKAMVCLTMFDGLISTQPKTFPCEFCADDLNPFYNMSQFCVLKGIVSNAVNGSKLETELGWLANGNFCRWLGVTCDSSQSITELILEYPNIPVTFGNDLGKLITLQKLTVIGNSVYPNGDIPKTIFQLRNLTSMTLQSTSLRSLPDNFDKIPSLQNLVLARNERLGDSIPSSIGSLSLKSLTISAQNISGNIPNIIGNSKTLQNSLTYLDLGLNQLTGNFPISLLQLKSLTSLSLANNNISGPIPDGIGSSGFNETMKTLDLSGNSFSGNIPNSINQLSNLRILLLQKNRLSGNIPTSMSRLGSLTELNFNNNQLTGNIDMLGSIKSLKKINLAGNLLSGSIPREICSNTYSQCDLKLNDLKPSTTQCQSCQL
ncbi:hypothetical protein G9A89_017298 [Geosiphon pyriformis]|nr:hypothetical protein G9A89_017298 [Geosiphon pyriformis]